jgi:hypothetical protein
MSEFPANVHQLARPSFASLLGSWSVEVWLAEAARRQRPFRMKAPKVGGGAGGFSGGGASSCGINDPRGAK